MMSGSKYQGACHLKHFENAKAVQVLYCERNKRSIKNGIPLARNM